ncbi:hypothetical protein V8E36_000566 [Tilletia maclaganii]
MEGVSDQHDGFDQVEVARGDQCRGDQRSDHGTLTVPHQHDLRVRAPREHRPVILQDPVRTDPGPHRRVRRVDAVHRSTARNGSEHLGDGPVEGGRHTLQLHRAASVVDDVILAARRLGCHPTRTRGLLLTEPSSAGSGVASTHRAVRAAGRTLCAGPVGSWLRAGGRQSRVLLLLAGPSRAGSGVTSTRRTVRFIARILGAGPIRIRPIVCGTHSRLLPLLTGWGSAGSGMTSISWTVCVAVLVLAARRAGA